MSYTIAIAGKGGTGKTTIASLLVRLIKENKLGSVLAVDADPNSNLAEVLGVKPGRTIGNILDDICAEPQKVPTGMSKDRFIEYEVQKAVQEEDGFDVVSMGKPEGPGCYCYVNNVLRAVMAKLVNDYDYVIIDNEAGLEHLSRRTIRSADVLLAVSDATAVGLKASSRIAAIVDELKIKVKNRLLLINRFDQEIDQSKVSQSNLQYIGNLPVDKEIARLSLEGISLWELKKDSLSLTALAKLGDKIWRQK